MARYYERIEPLVVNEITFSPKINEKSSLLAKKAKSRGYNVIE